MFEERAVAEYSERSLRLASIVAGEPVLQDFSLRRVEGTVDGHIGHIAISRRERLGSGNLSYLLAFADDDADEAGRGDFTFVDLASLGDLLSVETVAASDIHDSQTLSFTSARADHTALLSGFSLARQGGGDQHLRELAINPTVNGYSVTFRDDNPSDDRYSASANAVFVPNANVLARHSFQIEDAVGSIDVPREVGQAALCGFSFKYLDSDHHIRHLEVKLSGDRIRMAMRDNDRNRRFQATVEYAILQD